MLMERTEGVKIRSFTLLGLSDTERVCLECLKQIASEGRIANQYEICAAIGTENTNGGTVAGVVNRLVSKGHVERIGGPLQKSMWLRIVATGQTTAEPRDKTPHWRYRKEAVPSPAIHHIRQRSKTIAQRIEEKARKLGKPVSEYLMDLVYVGLLSVEEEEMA